MKNNKFIFIAVILALIILITVGCIETKHEPPSSPERFELLGVRNGMFKVSWEPVEGVEENNLKGYLIAQVDKEGQPDIESKPYHLSSKETTSTWVSGCTTQKLFRYPRTPEWKTEKEYEIAVFAVSEKDKGFIFSEPSETIDVYIPKPDPPELSVEWEPVDGEITKADRVYENREHINSNKIDLTGEVDQENVKIDVLLNDERVKKIEDKKSFSHRFKLQLGLNKFTIKAKNKDGERNYIRHGFYYNTPRLVLDWSPVDGEKAKLNYNSQTEKFADNEELGLEKEITQDTVKAEMFFNNEKVREFDGEDSFKHHFKLQQGLNRILILIENEDGSDRFIERSFYINTTDPVLIVYSPEDGEIVSGTEVIVEGKTEADAELRINDKKINLNDNTEFSTEVELKDYKNTIEIVAKDDDGNKNKFVPEVDSMEHYDRHRKNHDGFQEKKRDNYYY